MLCIEIFASRTDLVLTPDQQLQVRRDFYTALAQFTATSRVVLTNACVEPSTQGAVVHAWCMAPSGEAAMDTLAAHLADALATDWQWWAGTTHVACADN